MGSGTKTKLCHLAATVELFEFQRNHSGQRFLGVLRILKGLLTLQQGHYLLVDGKRRSLYLSGALIPVYQRGPRVCFTKNTVRAGITLWEWRCEDLMGVHNGQEGSGAGYCSSACEHLDRVPDGLQYKIGIWGLTQHHCEREPIDKSEQCMEQQVSKALLL